MKKTTLLKFFGICFAMLLVIGLIACGSNDETGGEAEAEADSSGTEENTEKSAETEESGEPGNENLVFGNIAYDMKDVWNKYGAEAFEYAGEEMGVETIVLDAENDLEKSVTLMEELIQKDVDGISIFPISPEQGATLVRMANDAGIPVAVENMKLSDDAGDIVATVAAEYDIIGEEAFHYIAETYPGAKVLFAAGAKGGGVYETYQEGIDRAMEEIGDKVTIVDTVHGDWATEKTMNEVQSFINSGKEFDVIFANNEQMGKGAMNALVEAGLDEEVAIVSTGGGPDGLDMINGGEITATMSAPVSLQGLITFKNLYQHLNGKTPEEFMALPVIPVTKDTLDSAISWEADEKAVNYIGGLE
ncbi:sugar ABC transporter substrate-binding protein [Virgibacillus sp. W0181]|uniref:sugar ABC transporter substrate-binding protein n=1 Tax=Virgibacillus sp. W0181 TaxID=3391581 RepID=UPI003F458544